MPTQILGIGQHLPAKVERLGVRRPIVLEPIGPSTLAVDAAHRALRQANLKPDAIEFIIFATTTPDVTFPGSGCFFQDQMGCGTVGALDVRAQCAGFIFGLVIADQFIRTGTYARVLVVGAEVHSSGLDYSPRGAHIAMLYGDGAGAVLLGRGENGGGIRGAAIHTDGRQHDRFWCEYPSSRQHPVRLTPDDFHRGRHFPTIDLPAVQRFGEESLAKVIREALRSAGMDSDQVDCYIVAHLIPEVAERVGVRLGIRPSRLDVPAARYGHLAAAALPVALDEQVAAGKLGQGATVCLAASGAGFAWGAVVLTL